MSERHRQARGAPDPRRGWAIGKGIRLALDGFPTLAAGQPRHGRWRPASCQFIAGEPTPNDIGKCALPVRPGSSFCPLHHALCWLPPDLDRPGA